MKIKIYHLLLSLLIGTCLGMMLIRSYKTKKTVTEIAAKDSTFVKVENKVVANPKPVSSIITGEYFVPFVERKFITDTILVRDTIYVGGQTFYHETKLYKDSVLTAQVSGINASIDWYSVRNYTEYKYVYQEKKVAEKPKKWSICINSEYCYMPTRPSLPLGVNVQYAGDKAEYYIMAGKNMMNNENFAKIGVNIPIIQF